MRARECPFLQEGLLWRRRREDAQLGRERSAELARLTERFLLRRTKALNAAYLPPLASFVVFCRPSALQVRAIAASLLLICHANLLHTLPEAHAPNIHHAAPTFFTISACKRPSENALIRGFIQRLTKAASCLRQVALIQQLCQCGAVRSLLFAGSSASAPSSALASLTALRKLCNHPDLLHCRGAAAEGGGDETLAPGSDIERELAPLFPPDYQPGNAEHSGARMHAAVLPPQESLMCPMAYPFRSLDLDGSMHICMTLAGVLDIACKGAA